MGKRKKVKVSGNICNSKVPDEAPKTMYNRLTKEEYANFLTKYKDLSKAQIKEIVEKAYKH